MGLPIGLGLTVLAVVAVLMWRSLKALLLAIVLAASSAAAWLVWAESEYRGLTSCPWGTRNSGHPVLIGLALSVASAAVVTFARWRQDSQGWAAAAGLSTGVLAALVILVVAFFFGAGLRCTD